MQRRRFIQACGLAAGAALIGGGAPAQNQDRTRPRDRTRLRDPIRDEDIYGTQFMTQQERERYREERRAARDDDERQRLELYHRHRMNIRAREKGVILPDDPRGGYGMGGPGGRIGGQGGRMRGQGG